MREFLEVRMKEFVWSVNSALKSARFESCFAPFWLRPASATNLLLSTCSFAVARTFDVGELRFRRPHPVGVRGANLVERDLVCVERFDFHGFASVS